MTPAILRGFVLLFGVGLAAPAPADTVLAQGERIFRNQCSGCHSLDAGVHRAGPSLHGLVGRPVGSVVDYDYSGAFERVEFLWTPEMLDAFLADPQALLPGNIMVLWGLSPEVRAPLIRYLESAAAL